MKNVISNFWFGRQAGGFAAWIKHPKETHEFVSQSHFRPESRDLLGSMLTCMKIQKQYFSYDVVF